MPGRVSARMSAVTTPAIGSAAPKIGLIDRDGGTWQLADRLGKTVVLIFHRHIH